MSFWEVAARYFPYILAGVPVTLALTVLGILPGTAFGFILAMGRRSRAPWFRVPAAVYIDVVRGTPLVVQVFFFGFALPFLLHYTPPQWPTAVGVLAFNSSAYIAEIFRAAINGVPRGQWEAARSLGLTHNQALLRVILPQALRIAIPPWGNEFVALLKDSSLLFLIGVAELTTRGSLAQGHNFRPEVDWAIVAFLYLVFTVPLMHVVRRLEGRFSAGGRAL